MRKYYICDEGFKELEHHKEAYWIDICQPDLSDTLFLTSEMGVPESFLEYLQDKDERPREEREGDWKMTILRIPVLSHDKSMPFDTVPLGIISRGPELVFTVCYHPNKIMDDFAEHTRQKQIVVDSIAGFVLRIFYSTAYWYLFYLRTISNDVVGAEKSLEKAVENSDLMRLMRMQKSLVYFNTSIKGNVMVLERFQKWYETELDAELAEDVDIELRQADTTVGIYSDILGRTMDTYASVISNNMNGVVKRMSGLSIILMVPTFVASLYGMNVDILIGNLSYAFWLIIALSALLTTVAFLLLRRLQWV